MRKKILLIIFLIINIVFLGLNILFYNSIENINASKYTYISHRIKIEPIKLSNWQEYNNSATNQKYTFLNMTKDELINLVGTPITEIKKEDKKNIYEYIIYFPSYGEENQDSTHIIFYLVNNKVVNYKIDCENFWPEKISEYFNKESMKFNFKIE